MISVAAELAGVHPQTLRIYERKGLLEPSRTAGGSRRYSEGDIERLQRIAELTDEGLNLAGVKRVLRAGGRARPRCASSSSELAGSGSSPRRARSAASRRDLVPFDAAIAPFRAARTSCDGAIVLR